MAERESETEAEGDRGVDERYIVRDVYRPFSFKMPINHQY